jgi:hypothetical protein
LASGRLSLLLALEVAPIGRATADRHGTARADPADEHGESALGIATHSWWIAEARVWQSSVAKYMVKRRGPPSQGWKIFLRNHAPDIAAIDLFVVPTIGFDLLYAFVIVSAAETSSGSTSLQILQPNGLRARSQKHSRGMKRRATWSAIATGSMVASSCADCAPWASGMAHYISVALAECFCQTADRIDPAWMCGHVIVLGEAHLRRILKSYSVYYNNIRTHRSLDKDAPVSRPAQRIGSIKSHAILGGLHHHYARA